jgi:hypothetical protein
MHLASAATTTIYIRLLEEATTCLRPTQGVLIAGGVRRIPSIACSRSRRRRGRLEKGYRFNCSWRSVALRRNASTTKAAKARNKIVHVGEKAPDYKELGEMLEAIRDFLWICDVYRGQLKNASFISDHVLKEWKNAE